METDKVKDNGDLQNLLIETIESNSGKKNRKKRNKKNINDVKEATPLISEVNVVKTTVVKERVLSTKKFASLALDGPAPSISLIDKTIILEPKYEARSVDIDASLLSKIEVDRIGCKLIVRKVGEDARKLLNPGDCIIQVNEKHVYLRGDLENLKGPLKLLVEPAPLYHAPPVFYRILEGSSTGNEPIEKGEVVQVLSTDEKTIQVRNVKDLTHVGYLPANVSYEKVSMMSPFGRRVLVLLGASGVGRRSLKSLLLRTAPHFFATVTPLTSRARKPGEKDGREYEFIRKEVFQEKIRNGGMVEWGELDKHFYGTSADSVRQVIRSGRMCVLDCSPQALNYLYNGEFMPYVVHVAPPPADEFLELEQLRLEKKSPEEIHRICSQDAEIQKTVFNKIHLKLTNRNVEITFKRLLDSLENLRYESQWVPEPWMC